MAALIGDGLAADDRRMFAIGIVCLLLSPITITLPIFDALDSRQRRSESSIQESLLNPTAGAEDDDKADEKRRVAAENAMLPMHNTLKMISGVDCWLLWIGVAALAGGGQLVSANVNQMCESLGASLLLQSVVAGSWNAFLRLPPHFCTDTCRQLCLGQAMGAQPLQCLSSPWGMALVVSSLAR